MTKTGVNKAGAQAKAVQKILITQPRPESEKSPYFELARKYSLELAFHPFIRLEGIPAREFRKQKIEIQQYTGGADARVSHRDWVPTEIGLGPYDVSVPDPGPARWGFDAGDEGWSNVMDLTGLRGGEGVRHAERSRMSGPAGGQ